MSESEKKRAVPGRQDVPASKSHDKAMNKKQPAKSQKEKDDSDAIERAVYDGMQDLRVKKPG
jgi:hypothetical protein